MNRSTQNSEELFDRIRRLSDEANWSVDELRDALRAEGIDPEQLVREIKTKIEELSHISLPQPDHELLPLLPNLRRISGLKATAIAEKLGLPVTFLSDLSSHPQVVPGRARKELAKRASANLPGVGELDVLNSFDSGLYQQAAAYRDAPFPEEEIDFEKVVRRSDMPEEQIQYWLSLAYEE